MPYGLRNSFSSNMTRSTRRSRVSSRTAPRRRPPWPVLSGSWMKGPQPFALLEEPYHLGGEVRLPLEISAVEDGDRAQGQQPDHRAHLEAFGPAVGQPEHVVEEAVLLVPHPGPLAGAHEGVGDPEEVLDELQRHIE